MSSSTTGSVNAGYPLAITPPEEGAGAAYAVLKTALLEGFNIAHVELPMDMASRVQTNGQAVADASAFVIENPHCIYVKGPGITPRDDQVLSTIVHLEKAGKLTFTDSAIHAASSHLRATMQPATDEAYAAFAVEVKKLLKPIGSPNAAWRNVLEANLARGTSDALSERSLVNPPHWDASTPLTTYAFAPTAENQKSTIKHENGEFSVEFAVDGKDIPVIIGKQKVSAGTPLRLYTATKATFDAWVDGALADAKAKGAKITHGMKQTVLKVYDEAQRQWLQQAIERHGMSESIAPYALDAKNPGHLNNLLVDDLFSRLSTSELKEPIAILSPNHSYAAYVRDVWQKVAQYGGLKAPQHSEIVRASATGDHYKAIEFKAADAGTLQIKDSNGIVRLQSHLQVGDVAMVTHLDQKRVKGMIRQTLENARSTGRTNVLFGFDADGDYSQTAIAALEAIRGDFNDLNIQCMDAAEATARYLTGGVKDTVLMLNNIFGDFATDIEINGKGTSYSTGTMFDGRGVVELGSGGTAPDLIDLWKQTGTLVFNPMSFVEGIGLALGFAAQKMDKQGAPSADTKAIAAALEHGVYASTDKGIVPPIVKGKFRTSEAHTPVSTPTFLQSVKVEAMKHLAATHPALAAGIAVESTKLADAMALDTAIFAADAQFKDRWRAANAAWNAAREAAGEINPFAPDYSITLDAGMNPQTVTPEQLLALQEARAAASAGARKAG